MFAMVFFFFFTSIHFAYYIIELYSGFDHESFYSHPTPLPLELDLKDHLQWLLKKCFIKNKFDYIRIKYIIIGYSYGMFVGLNI